MINKERPLNITWSQFEVCNSDTRSAFENMCWFLFNTSYFGGKGLFHADSNNPGIEIVPIFHEESGKWISFQAKYFTSLRNGYSQIKDSAKQAIKYYEGKLDVIYLYCNKDLTTSSKSYKDILYLLNSKNISLVPITNQAILEQVLRNDTAWYYFGAISNKSISHFIQSEESPIDDTIYKHIMDHLAYERDHHPSFHFMKADPLLFPNGSPNFVLENKERFVEYQTSKKKHKTISLEEFFRESWKKETQNHILIEGEGGIGKTVSLLSLALEEGFLPHKVPAIYIPLYRMNNYRETDDGIGRYIQEHFSDDLLKIIYNLSKLPWQYGPRVILLLDGFNEVAVSHRRIVETNIADWAARMGTQIITTSRFLPEFLNGFCRFRLLPLSKENIRRYLKKKRASLPRSNGHMWDIIRTPLMLELFLQTEAVQKQMQNKSYLVWRKNNKAGDLFWNYVQKELFRCINIYNAPAGGKTIPVTEYAYALLIIAPYISWEMQKLELFSLSDVEIRQHLKNAVAFCEKYILYRPQQIEEIEWEFCDNLESEGNVLRINRKWQYEILTKEVNLFYLREDVSDTGKAYVFIHQNFRDVLAAMHLRNIALAISMQKNIETIPQELREKQDYFVLRYMSELFEDHIINAWWGINRAILPTDILATHSILDLIGIKNFNDYSRTDFHEMDLRNISLYRYHMKESSVLKLPSNSNYFKDTRISQHTFSVYGHTAGIESIAVSIDGEKIVSASSDHTIRVWDMRNGNVLNVLEGHTWTVESIAISRNGEKIVSASGDNTVRIWDAKTGELLSTLEGHSEIVCCVAISPDGTKIASGSFDDTVRIWEMKTGKLIRTLRAHTSTVHSITFSFDGKKLLTSSYDHTIKIWDIKTFKNLLVLEGHNDWVECATISQDGKRIVSCGGDKTVRVWDGETGTELMTLRGHTSNIWSVAISPDGKKIVSGSSDQTIRIWDMGTGKKLLVLKGHTGFVKSVALSADGRKIVSGSWDRTIRVWDIQTGECLMIFDGQGNSVRNVTVSLDGRFIVGCADDRVIRVWDAANGKLLHILEGHKDWVKSIVISPDGKKIVSGSADKTVRVWDIESGKTLYLFEGYTGDVNSVALSPDGRTIASGSFNKAIKVWSIENGELLMELDGHEFEVNSVKFNSSGDRIISGSEDTTVMVWSASNGRRLLSLKGHDDSVRCVDINTDGIIASSSDDETIRLWDINNGNTLTVVRGSVGDFHAFAFSKDGKRLICGGISGYIDILDVKTGDVLQTLKGHSEWINSIAVCQDGKTIVSGSEDGTIRVWDMKSGVCKKCITVLSGISLIGSNLSKANFESYELKETLYQNGATVD